MISGWGNYSPQPARLLIPPSCVSVGAVVKREGSLIARGMARSYGDSANAPSVLQTLYCDRFIEFNGEAGEVTAEAGVTLQEILRVITPRGWFLPVTPGTSFVTLGGAIASDVHGKNHHIAGTFGQYVTSMRIVLGTGAVVVASRTKNADLFHATCGGMGLTGVVISATIKLLPIGSSFIDQKTIRTSSIDELCESFELFKDASYSVAWLDCLSRRKNSCRGILSLGEHAEFGGLEIDKKRSFPVPFNAPRFLLNNASMKFFNYVYWHKEKHNKRQVKPLISYFYPLDVIGDWNRLYGKAGFLQYQCVIPRENGAGNIRRLLTLINESGDSVFLAVLKKLGVANNNLLSFPIEGYTLALDFKFNVSTIETLHKLDDFVANIGGRVYLAKDAVMREEIFKATYGQWEAFESVREKYGAIGKFSSTQSKRLGLS